jgi:hypothetical protein
VPLTAACLELYDKNIKTVSTTANRKDVEGGYVGIGVDALSLSEENLKVVQELDGVLHERNGIKDYSLRIPVGLDTSVEEIRYKSLEIAHKFKKQEMTWAPTFTINQLR